MILAFEPAEAVRNLIYLKKGGIVIVNSVPVKPVQNRLPIQAMTEQPMLEYLEANAAALL